ncbi:hypothetical protein [Ramlibacter sp. WS9]|uniref:hypothetical protein n=1 Tax=Ramlibacter sp. WS9 TaxID=1882741 RepID=UPI001142374D|nr:hypothetical protein [Ramlibacter sp. WS9]ROZ62936.1 hypothetical protein EEB15_30500 [Ramlibacter sp. WS9]
MSQKPSVSQELLPPWGATLRVYLEPATLRMLFLGFSAGLPLPLVPLAVPRAGFTRRHHV